MESQKLWDKYTVAKYSMLMSSNTDISPWIIVRSDDKKKARINCIKHILNNVSYGKKIDDSKIIINKKIIVKGSKEIEKMEQENKFARA